MSKSGEKILAGAAEALAFARGERVGYVVHVPESVDVRSVRAKLGLSQSAFAARFGFDLATIRNWEQGRRRPEGPARLLLKMIERRPDVVDEVLAA